MLDDAVDARPERDRRRWLRLVAVATTTAVLLVAGLCAIFVPPATVADATLRLRPSGVADALTMPGATPRLPLDPRITASQLSREAALYAARVSAVSAERQGLRAAILAFGVGLLTALGLYVRWRGQSETERHNAHDAAQAIDERRDARFATAIEHLAHRDPSVKIGGIYTLEALAREDPAGRSVTTVQILTSFTETDRRARSTDDNPPRSSLPNRVAYAAAARARVSPVPLELGSADLEGADLIRADLNDADLIRADLSAANLNGAHLREADLSNANLRDADLSAANYVDRHRGFVELSAANLDRAVLSGADLRGAVLTGVFLRSADLRGADLRGADLTEANLSAVVLSGVDLSSVNLRDAHLYDANLKGANLSGLDLSGVNLRNANLRDADLSKTALHGASLRGANLAGALLRGVDLRDTDLTGANLSGADLRGAWLMKANLRGAFLFKADLSGGFMLGADLSEAIGLGSHPSHAPHRGKSIYEGDAFLRRLP